LYFYIIIAEYNFKYNLHITLCNFSNLTEINCELKKEKAHTWYQSRGADN